jgi:TonB family protein
MTDLLLYGLRAHLLLGLFFGCYYLLLRRSTWLTLNRTYLTGSLVAALLLPLLPLPALDPLGFWVADEATVPSIGVGEGYVVAQVADAPANAQKPDWLALAGWLYAAVAGTLLLRLGWRVGRLLYYLRQWPADPRDGYTVLRPDTLALPTFSFFRYLVLNPADETNVPVWLHERTHIRQWHSADVLLAEVMYALFWPNPALWGYKRAIRQVHEFLADRHATDQTPTGRDQYARLLVSYAFALPADALTHTFSTNQPNFPTLKQRIQMLYQTKTPRWAAWKYALVLPLSLGLLSLTTPPAPTYPNVTVANVPDQKVLVEGRVIDHLGKPMPGANIVVKNGTLGTTTDANGWFRINVPAGTVLVVSFVGFGSEEMAVTTKKVKQMVMAFRLRPVAVDGSKMPIADLPPTPPPPPGEDNDEVFNVVERNPMYPGGEKAMFAFLGNTIRYPKEAVRRKVQGKVFINFVVERDGSLSRFKVLKGIGAGCDQEAVRVMKQMPKWIPGKQNGQPVAVLYNLPIAFQLEEDKKVGARTQPEPAPAETGAAMLPEVPGTLRERLDQQNSNPVSIRVQGIDYADREPLYIIDGLEYDKKKLDHLDPNTIASINILKGSSAFTTYGEKGKDGVIIIKTKQAKKE